MDIYIDESGLFVPANKPGSWSVVAAFAIPGKAMPALELALNNAKEAAGFSKQNEVKLKHFQNKEQVYFRFLEELAALDGLLFAIASDSSANPLADIREHQRTQVATILQHIDKMRYEGGRKGVSLLGSEVACLSPQLYVQNACQIELMYEVFERSINYFAQRHPETLAEFRWRIDRKDASPSSFEAAFEKLSPALLQSKSIETPFAKVKSPDFDYSYLDRFEMPVPSYLKDDYGVELSEEAGLDIQRIIRGDIEFVDSSGCAGVQVVDLVVSGLRRCLRSGFDNNERAAIHLGRLMVQAPWKRIPIRLLGFGKKLPYLDERTSRLVKIMQSNAKPMFRRDKQVEELRVVATPKL
jgi:hypothetical protein